MPRNLAVEISAHAVEQMRERGATESEVNAAIQNGEIEPVSKGRKMYRKNFQFNGTWRGKKYGIKQVAPFVAVETDKLVVVTIFVFAFREKRSS